MKKSFIVATLVVITSALSLAANASDVYINQSGENTTIDILQESGMNRVNTDAEPAIISGDGIQIDIVQDGDLNIADIFLRSGSDNTILDYIAFGDLNVLLADFSNALNNEILIDIDGSANEISLCGDLECMVSSTVADTKNTINIDGDYNQIRMALANSDAENFLDITGGSINHGNTVDITQTGSGPGHITWVMIDGSSNSVTIVQSQQ